MGKSTRPKVERRDTRKTTAKADAELDRGIALEFKGKTYEVRVGDVPPGIARELRQQTGYGFLQLFAAMATTPDLDLIAAWIWLARRIDGENVDLSEVDAEISYASIAVDLEVHEVEGPGEPTGPEA